MASMRWYLPVGALVAALCSGGVAPQALTVCMAEDNPPLSYRAEGEMRGLDIRLAQALAGELQRELKIVPFESKFEGESTLSQEVNALLSSDVCDVASGFALMTQDLGAPGRATARAPDYPGAKRRPLRPWVPLGTLVPSRGYHAMAMALVVNDGARESMTLADPGDARIGVVGGTLAGTAVSLYRNGKLRPQLVGLARNLDVLEQLEARAFDATLVAIHRLDAWHLRHPGSPLRRTSYVHPLRINLGLVARSEAQATIAAADRVIERALGSGELQRWAAQTGTTWVAPVEPQVATVGLIDLLRE